MGYIVFSIKNCGLLCLPYLAITGLRAFAFSWFTKLLSTLPKEGFSFSQFNDELFCVLAIFVLTPIANMIIILLMNVRIQEAVTKNFDNHFFRTDQNPSILGRCTSNICQYYSLPLIFLQAPMTFFIFCWFLHLNLFFLLIALLISIAPLIISYWLGKEKIKNAKKMFESQNKRAHLFGKWLKNKTQCNIPKNLFSEELIIRKTESFLDESSNILPYCIILMTVIFFWWMRILIMQDIVIVYVASILFIEKITELYTSVSQLVRINQSYLMLTQKSLKKQIC